MKKKNISFKSFLHKYNKIFIFLILLLVSFGVTLYFASAINNDDNKYTVTDITISNISDGTANFDSTTDTNGNDANNNNGVVRTYDSIRYDINYKLSVKSGETASLSDDRKVVIDVLIPAKVEGKVNGKSLSTIFGTYSYVEYEIDESVSEENKSISITLTDISATTNTVINPKFYIREKTDTSTISISNLPDDKKNSFSSATSVSGFSDLTPVCNNTIGETKSCETKVTAKEDYIVNIFKGGNTKDDLSTNFQIGYMIGMKSENNKGIKGKYIPSTVEFTINSSTKIGTQTIGTDKDTITFGTTINQVISENLYMCDNCNEKLKTVSLDSGSQNGNIGTPTQNSGSLSIKVTDIKSVYVALNGNQYVAFSTGALTLNSERANTQVIGDIDISLNTNKANSNTLTIVDKQNRYLGVYSSTVDLYDSSSSTKKSSGQAIINYGESFIIENNIHYAETGGDDLDSLTSYIKIDNSAISLINFEEGDSGTKSISASITIGNNNIVPAQDDILFYYGDWTTDYFERTADADSYNCPTDISSRETLMNLYGGPCIKEKAGMIKTYKDLIIDDASATGTNIPAAYYQRGPILVKATFRSTDTSKIKNVSGKIKLAGKVKNLTSLINTTHQIVTSATGEFTGTESTSPSSYYLSNVINTNGTSLMTNANNYSKTIYDATNKKVTTLHNNVCNNVNCAISGNTIIVSAAKASKPNITTTYNSSEKDSFYYYPIEWNIVTSGYISDNSSSLRDLTIDLYLPSYLIYTSAETITDFNKDGQVGQNTLSINPRSQQTVDNSSLNEIRDTGDSNTDSYVKYTFYIDFTTDDYINTIPKLKVYTNIKLDTPKSYNFHGYTVVNYGTTTNTIGINNIVSQSRFETIEPIKDRSNSTEITVHNDAEITTQGTLTPRYLEKNESYTYKMQAYNNSGTNISNSALYYVLPYKGDSAYEDLQSKFEATDFKVKLESLPEGYTAYYNTGGLSANIINNELHPEISDSNSWVKWTSPTAEITGINAIKIVKDTDFTNKTYFAGDNGVIVQVTPVGSNVGDIYYNQFYMITGNSNKNSYPSSRDRVSIYNRIISGFVWEDYDYNGLSNDEESKLENIPVSLYKISDSLENYDANDPTTFVGQDGEEWVSDTTTDSNGRYTFTGLTEGKYYAKFTYDDKKYTITKRDATNSDNTPATSINSKARSYSGGNVAISSIVTFDKLNNSSYDSLNLGLTIRKEFVVDVKNYIKNVTITSDNGTDSYDYDKATTVSITLKNTNNKTAKVTYDFVVENTKYFPGYVGLIQDIMPEGMTFNSNIKENQDWVLSGGVLYYTGLSGKLLVPNEKYYFSLVLDFEITSGGNYINFVSLDNLVLMGDEIPEFDFSTVDTTDIPEESSSNEETNNGEGE